MTKTKRSVTLLKPFLPQSLSLTYLLLVLLSAEDLWVHRANISVVHMRGVRALLVFLAFEGYPLLLTHNASQIILTPFPRGYSFILLSPTG